MKRNSFIKKILVYLLCACLLTALLTGCVYGISSARVLSNRVAHDLLSRARSIAFVCSKYLDGQMLFDSLYAFMDSEIRGAHIGIYDAQGTLLMWSKSVDEGETKVFAESALEILETGAPSVKTDWMRGRIAVAVPIRDNFSRINGVVVLSKPVSELRDSIEQLSVGLPVSVLLAAFIMLVPTAVGVKRLLDPVKNMTAVSKKMAEGDFSVQIDVVSDDELGQLGSTLNYLSERLSATIRDLTATKERLTTILRDIKDGVLALGADFRSIIYINEAAQQLLSQEGTSNFCSRFQPVFEKAIGDLTPKQAQFESGDRLIRLNITPSLLEKDETMGIVVVLQDITEAERLEQTRRDYVANVSHELRTPISSICSLAETLRDGMVHTEEDRNKYYGYILRESQRLSRLINDLLELSRLQSLNSAFDAAWFDINSLLVQVSDRMSITAAYSGINLQLQKPCLPECYSNRDRVEQVLVALIDNAIKYAEDDGEVVIRSAYDDRNITIEVLNSGTIPKADLPHLFERFYKVDKAHSQPGTGLGLAIVWETVARLGGTIGVSNNDGYVVFRFSIPISSLTIAKQKNV